MSHRNEFSSRRYFLAGGMAGAALLLTGAAETTKEKKKLEAVAEKKKLEAVGERKKLEAVAERKKDAVRGRVGVQLYSVRQDCARDLPGTIAAIAKMGYAGVEFAGYHGRGAKELRALLDDHGLACCGTHIGIDTLLGDALPATIEFNQALGNKYLIVPGLAEKYRSSRAAWVETAKRFNEIAERIAPHGMLTGYHNHSIEFQPMDGELPWDTFMRNTRDDVIMQLDTGNALHGGADPLPFVYRYPGRAVTVHVKEYSKTDKRALVGEGDINWKAFFALCRAVGGTEWFIVEQESYAYEPMECIARCLKNLRRMGLV